jgi:hypothetical protein
MFVTYLLYFGYMGVISLGVFLITGMMMIRSPVTTTEPTHDFIL